MHTFHTWPEETRDRKRPIADGRDLVELSYDEYVPIGGNDRQISA